MAGKSLSGSKMKRIAESDLTKMLRQLNSGTLELYRVQRRLDGAVEDLNTVRKKVTKVSDQLTNILSKPKSE